MLKQAVAVCFGLLFAGGVFAAGSSAPSGNDDLDAKLAEARARLEAAARDVAQLSSQLSGQLSQQLSGQIASATAEGMRQAAESMRAFRTRAVLGLQVQTEPPAKEQGVRVLEVSPGGPAAEAGVHSGDVIVALNEQPTTGPGAPRDLVERMTGVQPDSKVSLKLLRDGKPLTVQVVARPAFNFAWTGLNGHGMPVVDMDDQVFQGAFGPGCGGATFLSGVELAPVSPHLGEYFGVKQGVLVVRAEQLGMLQDGDVIMDIDGRVPQNGAHAIRILCSYQPGEKVRLDLMRQRKPVAEFLVVPSVPRGRSGHAAPRANPMNPLNPANPVNPPNPLNPLNPPNVLPAPQAPQAPPAAQAPAQPPPISVPFPALPNDDECLNPRGPRFDPMPGSEVPCVRLPDPRVMPLAAVTGNTG